MILDTNAVSDFADGDEKVLRRLRNPSTVIHLPVIVLGEYRYGLKSSRQRAARERWLDELGQARLFSILSRPPAAFTPKFAMSFV